MTNEEGGALTGALSFIFAKFAMCSMRRYRSLMVEHDIIVGDAEFESRTDPISFSYLLKERMRNK